MTTTTTTTYLTHETILMIYMERKRPLARLEFGRACTNKLSSPVWCILTSGSRYRTSKNALGGLGPLFRRNKRDVHTNNRVKNVAGTGMYSDQRLGIKKNRRKVILAYRNSKATRCGLMAVALILTNNCSMIPGLFLALAPGMKSMIFDIHPLTASTSFRIMASPRLEFLEKAASAAVLKSNFQGPCKGHSSAACGAPQARVASWVGLKAANWWHMLVISSATTPVASEMP